MKVNYVAQYHDMDFDDWRKIYVYRRTKQKTYFRFETSDGEIHSDWMSAWFFEKYYKPVSIDVNMIWKKLNV